MRGRNGQWRYHRFAQRWQMFNFNSTTHPPGYLDGADAHNPHRPDRDANHLLHHDNRSGRRHVGVDRQREFTSVRHWAGNDYNPAWSRIRDRRCDVKQRYVKGFHVKGGDGGSGGGGGGLGAGGAIYINNGTLIVENEHI